MEIINQERLTDLLEEREGVHISLFMPVERESDKVQANRIRLKSLIKQAEQQLTADGFLPSNLSVPDLEQLFEPAAKLLQNGNFVVDNNQGLALFLTPHTHRIYRLPLPLDELAVAAPRFYIKPLLPNLTGNERFYLLSLSQKQVQLWHGSLFSLDPVAVPELPDGMSEALALEDPERVLQFHTSTGPRDGRPASYHGHDSDKEKKGAILRYFRQINEAVQNKLAGENTPLLLASVAYLKPIYDEANTYPHLLSEVVAGNPDTLPPHELHEQAWQAVQPHFEQTKNAAAARYQELKGTEMAAGELVKVIPAAAYGRVDTLFVPIGVQISGKFSSTTAKVELCDESSFGCEDLINFAAVSTLTQGGTVFAVQPEEMPDQGQIAAIFRYSS